MKSSSDTPNKKDVSMRALCLGALLARSGYENHIKTEPSHKTINHFMALLNEWTEKERTEGLNAFFSNSEQRLMCKALGGWEEKEITDVSWRLQALGTLLWGLSFQKKMPSYDVMFSLEDIISHVLPSMPTENFLDKAKLRNSNEIIKERDRAQLWNWRSRTHWFIKQGKEAPEGWTWDKIINMSAEEGFKDKSIPKPIQDDFPMFGKAFKDITNEQYFEISSSIQERHYALNWICGYAKNWDEVPTET